MFFNSIYKCYHPFFATCFCCCCFTLHFWDESGFTQVALECSFFVLLHLMQCCSTWIVYKLLTFLTQGISIISICWFVLRVILWWVFSIHEWRSTQRWKTGLDFRVCKSSNTTKLFSEVVALLYTLHGYSTSSSIFCIIGLTKLLPIS